MPRYNWNIVESDIKHHNPNSTYWYFGDYLLQEEVKEEEYNEEDLYAKAEQEFYKIIEEEKKLHERRQATKEEMDKVDKGKVCRLSPWTDIIVFWCLFCKVFIWYFIII